MSSDLTEFSFEFSTIDAQHERCVSVCGKCNHPGIYTARADDDGIVTFECQTCVDYCDICHACVVGTPPSVGNSSSAKVCCYRCDREKPKCWQPHCASDCGACFRLLHYGTARPVRRERFGSSDLVITVQRKVSSSERFPEMTSKKES